MIVVSNSSPIIILSKINRLLFLKLIFQKVFILEEVFVETVTNSPFENEKIRIRNSIEDFIQVQKTTKKHKFKRSLGSGEKGAILLALELNADVLILDDKKARLEAKELGLNLLFTSEIILEAENRGLIKSYENELTELKKFGIYLTPKN